MFLEIFSAIVLFLTLISVSVYTWLANKQKNELINQRRLSVMPSLIHDVSYDHSDLFDINIKNIGNGPAVNISIDDISVPNQENIKAIIHNINFLETGQWENKQIIFKQNPNNNTEIINSWKNYFIKDPKFRIMNNGEIEKFTICITFRFQDIEGNFYKQSNYLDHKGYNHGAVKLRAKKK